MKNKVNVWDTYVKRTDDGIMHFDIIVPAEISDTSIIYGYGKEYLELKGHIGRSISANQCRLCHMENLQPEWEEEIVKKGYFIVELEGCD